MRPPKLPRIEREHRGATLKPRRKYILADHSNGRIDIDEPIKFCAAMRRGQRRIPNRVPSLQRHRHDLAVIESADRHFFGDNGNRRTAQAQTRDLLLDRPELRAAVCIEAVQSAIDRAYHHDLFADGRSGEQLRIDLRAPQLTAGGAVQRDDRPLAAAGYDYT